MSHVFAPAPAVAVPVVGSSDQFPVRRIYCVGRNYEAHAREMGHDPDREPPFFFGKPADAVLYVAPGATGEFPYPSQSKNVHFEMELVAAVGKQGKDIPAEKALDYVYGYALGLDMTRRDLQAEAKNWAVRGTRPRASIIRLRWVRFIPSRRSGIWKKARSGSPSMAKRSSDRTFRN